MYMVAVYVELLLEQVDDIGDVRPGRGSVPCLITVSTGINPPTLRARDHPTVLMESQLKPGVVGPVTGSILTVPVQEDDQRC
ncbi:MAG TPA: hypothetical protein VMT42_00275 [candidate division Zixibacteria bacterium]|nr:hypothetical protein [candidate division Zixibacteria bacterium]